MLIGVYPKTHLRWEKRALITPMRTQGIEYIMADLILLGYNCEDSKSCNQIPSDELTLLYSR